MTQKSCCIMQLNFEPGGKKGTGLAVMLLSTHTMNGYDNVIFNLH
jgi:hypothetical protein